MMDYSEKHLRDEQNYLDYDPQLAYTPVKQPVSLPTPAGPVPITQSRPTVDQELVLLKQNPTANVLAALQQGVQEAQKLITDMSTKMAGNRANGMTFEEYIKVRKTDPAQAALYEQAHQGDIEGAMEMDILPVVLDTQDELAGIQMIMQDRFYPTGLPEDLSQAAKTEQAQTDALIADHLQGKAIPLDQIRLDNNLRDVISDKVNNARVLVRAAGQLLNQTLDQDTGGDALSLAQSLVNAGEHLSDIQALNALGFETHRDGHWDQVGKIKRLTPVSFRVDTLGALHDLQVQASRYQGAMAYLAGQDTRRGMQASSVMVANAATGLERIHQSLEATFYDNYRLNTLQGLQNAGFLDAVDQKRSTRQLHKLIQDVQQHYDPHSANQSQQLERVLRLQK